MNREKRLVQNAVHHQLLEIAEAAPSPYERQEADRAARKACRQLGLPPGTARVRFYSPFHPALPLAPGQLGSTDAVEGRTVWVQAGQGIELRASVRHEVGHFGQVVAGEQPNHDGLSTRDDSWRGCRVERFAQGDKQARKELRRGIRLAIQPAADVQNFRDPQKGTPT